MNHNITQCKIYSFYLITEYSYSKIHFEWEDPYPKLFIKILNTISSWPISKDVHDAKFQFPIGIPLIMSNAIKTDVENLRTEIMNEYHTDHKKQITTWYKAIKSVNIGKQFFILRIIRSHPTQNDLLQIMTALKFVNSNKTIEDAQLWYSEKVGSFYKKYNVEHYKNTKKGELDRKKRKCRFCNKAEPETTFKNVAHAIPESIGGTKDLICFEECDICNKKLAKVEDNLCNWFDFRRSQFGVTKKSGGIPNAYGRNYIIENQKGTVFPENDYKANDAVLAIGSSPVTLQGIYRALSKIAISLIDESCLNRLQTTIEWIFKGSPKSSKYPKIAQMYDLPLLKTPEFFIFSRLDEIDSHDKPLYFCILRIFDLALLFILPHIDSKMEFHPSYIASININALRLLGFNKQWKWESYDSCELRNPHVEVGIVDTEITKTSGNENVDKSKLRPEKKDNTSVDFVTTNISKDDIEKEYISKIKINEELEQVERKHCTGVISTECKFDIQARQPLQLKLKIIFEHVINKTNFCYIEYVIRFNPKIYSGNFNVTKRNIAINQEIISDGLNIALDCLFDTLSQKYSDSLFSRKYLTINNVNELLAKMKVIMQKNGKEISTTLGEKLWDSGYRS